MIQRGDIVIVDFPFTDVAQSKPAAIVQNDRDNRLLRNTIVALIRGNLRRVGDPSHLFIDPATADGAPTGLPAPSLVSCNNLFTIEQASIIRTIGRLSSTDLHKLHVCLKAALELP